MVCFTSVACNPCNLPALVLRSASAEVLLATLRFLVLGDGDGAGVIIGLYNNDEASHRKKLRC